MKAHPALPAVAVLAIAFAAFAPPAPADAPATRPAPKWRDLFDGKSLAGWTVSDFGGHGDPAVENAAIVLPVGEGLTGVSYDGDLPKLDYEVSLEARRVAGHDFFCGLTFPIGDAHASLIVGGWGGAVCGLSCIDGADASDNATTTRRKFETSRWYTIRLRITRGRVRAWIDDEPIVDVNVAGKKLSVRGDIEASLPFGLASWRTTAQIRRIQIRSLASADVK